ncbi:MAG: class I SAM-dependent methyltransferase [Burkholderiaceae bacterium]
MSELEHYYAVRANEYDTIYAKPERQEDLRAIEAWLPGLFRAKSVLEIACGTGYWTQFIGPVATDMVAVDASPETLAIAASRVEPGRVKLLAADAYDLPDFGRRFQSGFAGFWLSHVPISRLRDFLRAFHAALEPGATVVFIDNRYVEGSSTPISEQDDDGNTYQVRRLRNGETHRVLKNFPTEQALRDVTEGLCTHAQFRVWQYYWAFEYQVAH